MAPKKITHATPSAPAPVVEPVAPPPTPPEVEPASPEVEPASPEVEVDPIQAKLTKLTEYVASRAAAAKEELQICKDFAAMIRALTKEITVMQKKVAGRRQPKKGGGIGFTKPVNLSDALCDFLDLPHGSSLPRVEVTRALSKYINSNKLYNEANKRIILPDEKLSTLLSIQETDPPVDLTHFNMQIHIKRHYLKADVDEAAPAVASA